MTELAPERVAEVMRALRGERSQTEVSQLTQVPAHTIARLEKGRSKNPSWEDMVAIARGFGLSPNDMASLTGLWADEETASASIDPRVRGVLEEVRQYLAESPAQEQRFLAELIHACLTARKHHRSKLSQIESSTVIPDHIREKLTHS